MKLEAVVQMPIGVVFLGPALSCLKKDILKCILQGWKVLRTSCFTDLLLLAAMPVNVNTGFVVTLLDLANLLAGFYLCIFRCDWEILGSVKWAGTLCKANLGHTSYQPRNICVLWNSKRMMVIWHLSFLHAQCCFEVLEQHKSGFLVF